jgi:hypothetical protein
MMIAGKWVYTKSSLSADQLKAIEELKEDNPVITIAKWRKLNLLLFLKKASTKTSALLEHKRRTFRYISSRMAHTKPKVIAKTCVINSKMIGSNATRAWRGAMDTLGSLYFVPKSSNTVGNQITDFYPRARTITEASATMLAPPSPAMANQQQQETDKNAQPGEGRTKSAQATNPYAKQTTTVVAQSLQHKARLSVTIKIEKDSEKPANDQAIAQVKQLMKRYLQNDETTCILPWRIKVMDTCKAIKRIEDIPNKISELKKWYVEGIHPKWGATCWFKLHVGGAEESIHLTSLADSNTQDYFMDTGNLAYLTVVQESNDTVDLCHFIYSGPFSNAGDFEKCLQDILKGKGFRFGCRLKKTKEIPEAKNTRD